MGWRAAPGRFDFSAPERLLAFAREQRPAWAKALPPAELDRAMATCIGTVVGHYRDQLPSWDVVNEPIADDGTGLRRSLWLEGDDAKTQRKRQAFLKLLRQLRERGVPLNAVGLQAHLYANGSGPTTFRTRPAFLRELAALDLDILLTELDVNDRELPAAIPERDRAVATVYGDFLAAVLPEPRLKLITTWGLSDRTTWLNGFMPRADGLSAGQRDAVDLLNSPLHLARHHLQHGPPGQPVFFSLVLFLCDVTDLLTSALQFYPSLKYRPQQRRRQADSLLTWAKETDVGEGESTQR